MNKKKELKKKEEDEKINTLMSVLSINDKIKAKKLLIEHEWDAEKAAAFTLNALSSNNVFDDKVNNNKNKNSKKNKMKYDGNNSVIRIILPDNRQYTYKLSGTDTFWEVYSKLVQSVPQYSNKPFTFVLPNGHTLSESEFDCTLALCNLVPKGDIRVQFV